MVHTKDRNLLFSVSKDESVRLWNVKTRTCIAAFAGDKGHRDDVLSADVHMRGVALVTAGMDNTIKVWDLESKRLKIQSQHRMECACL